VLRHLEGEAVALLASVPALPSEETWLAPDGTRVRFSTVAGSPGRISDADADGNGVPDAVEVVGLGLAQARALLVDRLQLPPPAGLEVIQMDLGGRTPGYLARKPSSQANERDPWLVVLEAAPAGGLDAVRRTMIRQYAHAVVSGLEGTFPGSWVEAVATWAVFTIDGRLPPETAAALSRRADRLRAGLFPGDPELAAGNALWLSFLDEAYGPVTVRLTLEELASDGGPSSLDRALRRSAGLTLPQAFREFHLWTVLVGERADRYHFSFARELAMPSFASSNAGLPALSVQADAPVAPWGAAWVRFDTQGDDDGGLRLHFEGEFPARWESDLILVRGDGRLERLAMELSAEGRGEIAVPLEGVTEAWLMVRNLGSVFADGQHRRYTYAAHREPHFPIELLAFDAVEEANGVVVSWETASEHDAVGFDVLRRREGGGTEVAVNPFWIPALGASTEATSYVFIDQSVEPETSYVYRIRATTRRGLTFHSDAFAVRRTAPPGETPR
jgi:hypothetical protein